MKILNKLSDWVGNLQPRERLIITFGAALLIVAALYISILPAMQKNAELEQQYASLSEDFQWLREQRAVVNRLNDGCSAQAIKTGGHKAVISRTIRRSQLKLFGLTQNNEHSYSFSVSGASANSVLQVVHQLTCQGLALERLSINSSSDAKAAYSADIEVIYVD